LAILTTSENSRYVMYNRNYVKLNYNGMVPK